MVLDFQGFHFILLFQYLAILEHRIPTNRFLPASASNVFELWCFFLKERLRLWAAIGPRNQVLLLSATFSPTIEPIPAFLLVDILPKLFPSRARKAGCKIALEWMSGLALYEYWPIVIGNVLPHLHSEWAANDSVLLGVVHLFPLEENELPLNPPKSCPKSGGEVGLGACLSSGAN